MNAVYAISLVVTRLALALLGGLRVHGREKVPLEGPLIIAPNHCSYLDPPLVGVAVPRICHSMSKEELFRVPLLGWWITRLHVFPVKRGGADRAALRHALQVLKRGEVLVIFPEGTRTRDGRLGPAQPGIGLIAVKSGAPILPLYIDGTFRAWPRHRKLPRPARMSAWFGDLIPMDEYQAMSDHGEAHRLVAERVMAQLQRLQGLHGRSAAAGSYQPPTTKHKDTKTQRHEER